MNMFRVLYSERLSRGQSLTHQKNHKCIMQTECKCMLTSHWTNETTEASQYIC